MSRLFCIRRKTVGAKSQSMSLKFNFVEPIAIVLMKLNPFSSYIFKF